MELKLNWKKFYESNNNNNDTNNLMNEWNIFATCVISSVFESFFFFNWVGRWLNCQAICQKI